MEELAGLEQEKGLGWHALRRKFADEHRDAPPKEIADLGGRKTPHTVIEVYQEAPTWRDAAGTGEASEGLSAGR